MHPVEKHWEVWCRPWSSKCVYAHMHVHLPTNRTTHVYAHAHYTHIHMKQREKAKHIVLEVLRSGISVVHLCFRLKYSRASTTPCTASNTTVGKTWKIHFPVQLTRHSHQEAFSVGSLGVLKAREQAMRDARDVGRVWWVIRRATGCKGQRRQQLDFASASLRNISSPSFFSSVCLKGITAPAPFKSVWVKRECECRETGTACRPSRGSRKENDAWAYNCSDFLDPHTILFLHWSSYCSVRFQTSITFIVSVVERSWWSWPPHRILRETCSTTKLPPWGRPWARYIYIDCFYFYTYLTRSLVTLHHRWGRNQELVHIENEVRSKTKATRRGF